MARIQAETQFYTNPINSPTTGLSLSNFFPAGTHYFYGYPAGEDSGFFNKVPPYIEELVAARAMCCAGSGVNVVSFAGSGPTAVPRRLLDTLGIPRVAARQILSLPSQIHGELAGAARNSAVKASLLHELPPASLVMAQPYIDPSIEPLYQIPSRLTNWLNDKASLPHLIPQQYLPARLGIFKNGAHFAEQARLLSPPCVIKVSSSSSGDGVYMCRTQEQLSQAATALQHVAGTITIEAFIETSTNYAVHFGIPSSQDEPITIIGVNEQLTTADGSFVGGVIRRHKPTGFADIENLLLSEVLPTVRRMGWYGVGGIDVLRDAQGDYYFIDGNFRMTGMTAYHLLASQQKLTLPLVSFKGEFEGSASQLQQALTPLVAPDASDRAAHLIALSKHHDTWSCNGAITFTTATQMRSQAKRLLDAGLNSEALQQLV